MASPMLKNRRSFSATVLADGRVLVAGGSQVDKPQLAPFREAEIFSPSTGAWTATGSMSTGRDEQLALRLEDGRVLVAGGAAQLTTKGLSSTWRTETWDPVSGIWTDQPHMLKPRQDTSGVVLPDGRVLVTGGFLDDRFTNPMGGDRDINEAELFSP
jgi:hypothetical protein